MIVTVAKNNISRIYKGGPGRHLMFAHPNTGEFITWPSGRCRLIQGEQTPISHLKASIRRARATKEEPHECLPTTSAECGGCSY